MSPDRDTGSSASIATDTRQEQRSTTTTIESTLEVTFAHCTSALQDHITTIDTLHDSIQEYVIRFQAAIKAQAAQAAQLSAQDRRWVGAKHWQVLLDLDWFREQQDELMALKAAVE
ncbi:hypothetical protein SVAN01_10608 [Stagonosporopsis vannaccii]|nr:hypothetical protein SVAN01_10608 [Stagonosporopsis vannaccii]